MKTYTTTLTSKEIKKIIDSYPDPVKRFDLPYTLCQIKLSDVSITIYQSGKVVFQGFNAYHYAQEYIQEEQATTYTHFNTFPQGGSDEVGTGSYFGPITVCACLITPESIKSIPVERIQDSKVIQDKDILELAPYLMEKLEHSLLILNNKKYNELHKRMNINEIKAALHNQAFKHLYKKTALQTNNIIDQFVQEKTYYRYLSHDNDVFRHLHFETKAESKYLAVACASIIARYAFLKQLEAMSEHYVFDFPSGAGPKVDKKGREFVALYGKESLNKVAKLHFANTKRILNL